MAGALALGMAIKGTANFILKLVEGIGKGMKAIGKWLGEKKDAVWQKFKDIGNWFKEKGDAIKEWWSTNVTPKIDAAKEKLGELFLPLLTFYDEKIKPIVDWFKGLKDDPPSAGEVFAGMKTFWDEKVKEPIIDKWNNFVSSAKDLGSAIKGNISEKWTKVTEWWDGFKEGAVDLKDKIVGGAAAGLSKAMDFWENIKGGAVDLKDKLMGKLSGAWASIKTLWDALTNPEMRVDLVQKFKDALPEPIQKLINLWNTMQENDISLGDIFKGAIPDALQSVIDFFGGLFDDAQEGGIGYALNNAFENLVESLREPINNWIIDPINSLMGYDIPVIGPMQDLPGLSSFFPLTALAEGGIVNSPTLALIGEAGPEAVVPLNSQGRGMAGGNQTFNMTFNLSGITDRTDKRKLAQDVSQMIKSELRRNVGSTSVRGGLV
tara:strand:+ start:22528 stop:23829 length:1302 start_codon:yes stop_codon:yes gene_type:complete